MHPAAPAVSLRRSPSALLLRLCLGLLLASALLVAPACATKPVEKVELVFANSTSLAFLLTLPPGSDASELHVFVQPVLDGNATDAFFPITASPMRVDVAHLRPDSEYAFVFFLESSVNGSSSAVTSEPPVVRTHRLGPQIVNVVARDSTVEDTADPSVDAFSVGDTITLSFGTDTNTPAVGDKAAIDALFAFSGHIGGAYSGQWADAHTLVITIQDIGESSPPLGELQVTVIGDIVSPDGLSDVSRSVSPPLIGSFAPFTPDFPRYFWPVGGDGAAVSDPDNGDHYGLLSHVGEEVRIPLSLDFPTPPSRASGYGLNARVSYPTTLDSTSFALVGANFTYPGPVTGTTTKMSNAQLQASLRSLKLLPKSDYIGYCAVQVDLIDRVTQPPSVVSTVYMTVRIDGPEQPDIPALTVGGGQGSLLSNPINAIKTYQTPLIIGLCTVLGLFLLVGLGVFGYKKYKGSRDGRDFEAHSLTESEQPAPVGEGGPTRRFYYDAKV